VTTAVLLAQALARRLAVVVPQEFRFVAAGAGIEIHVPRGPSPIGADYSWFFAEYAERDAIWRVVERTLDNVQDVVAGYTGEVWPQPPPGEPRNLAPPDAHVGETKIRLWFGDAYAPVLELEPIPLSEIGVEP